VRTFAALVFIAGVAVAAIWVARIPTVADGRVLEAEILPAFRGQGVVGLGCDREIPVGRDGARFGCTASLSSGGRQRLDCSLERDGRFACAPGSGVMRDEPAVREGEQNAPPRDPWGN
jgi:hypothetical protein